MIPLIVSLIGAEFIKRAIKYREYIIFTLQDMSEEALFGSWILVDAGRYEEMLDFAPYLDKIIKAYIYIVGLPLIVARYGKEINETPFLLDYFSQFPSAKRHLQQIELGTVGFVPKPIKELFDNLTKLYPFEKPSDEEKEEWTADPIKFFNWLKSNIETIWQSFQQSPDKFVEWCCQNLRQAEYPEFLYGIPDWLVFLLNPFIEIDWVVIKTMIAILYAFRGYSMSMLWHELPRPYIPGMKIWIQEEDKVRGISSIKSDGSFQIQGETDSERYGDIYINIHGLAWRIPYVEVIRRFYVKVRDTGETIYLDEVKWTHTYVYTLPNFEKVVIVGVEDMKNQPNADFDYDDVIFYIYDRIDYLLVEIRGTLGTYTNDVYYEDYGFVVTCPPLNSEVVARVKISKDDFQILDIEYPQGE